MKIWPPFGIWFQVTLKQLVYILCLSIFLLLWQYELRATNLILRSQSSSTGASQLEHHKNNMCWSWRWVKEICLICPDLRFVCWQPFFVWGLNLCNLWAKSTNQRWQAASSIKVTWNDNSNGGHQNHHWRRRSLKIPQKGSLRRTWQRLFMSLKKKELKYYPFCRERFLILCHEQTKDPYQVIQSDLFIP